MRAGWEDPSACEVSQGADLKYIHGLKIQLDSGWDSSCLSAFNVLMVHFFFCAANHFLSIPSFPQEAGGGNLGAVSSLQQAKN